MTRPRKLMLPLVASVAMLLVIYPNFAYSQSTDSTEETSTTTTSTTTSATLEETTLTGESSTPTVSEPPSTTSESIEPPVSSTSPPEGSFNSPCNATLDCQPLKNLECLEGVCHCPAPQVFDLRVERCVIPLGKQCDSSDILNENMCPEFAECFMDRCVCKTGYSMHTLTRCKSDLIEASGERKPLVLWPPPSAGNEKEDSNEKDICNSETCDESKGLTCQEDKCRCKDSQEIYLEEFGRCLNTTVQKTLKDALAIVGTSDDEIKSFVKLLEKIDVADQESEGSDHYNSPVHQLLGLLGGDKYRDGSTYQSSNSQVAPPNSYRGDLHSAAQEHVGETVMPRGGLTDKRIVAGPPDSPISPVSAANAETSAESGEAMTYNSAGPHESVKRPSTRYGSLPLDNLHYSPQSQEPAIVQRQAPPYLQGDGIQGIGNNPAANHYRLPIQAGYGGGLGPYGGQLGLGPEGLGGYGQLGGLGGYGPGGYAGYGGLGGFGVPGGFRNPTEEVAAPAEAEPAKEKEGLLIDVAEFVGRSLKLVDRFLPLIHAINDALKKEGIFEKKEGGLFASIASAVAGARDRRFGEPSKEVEEVAKEEEGGDDTLKKLLT